MLVAIIPDLSATEAYDLAQRILTVPALLPDLDESQGDVNFFIQNGVIMMA